jgi:transcription initiation factor TFIIIB Brf1 subunit/transcription initiation factor TFIIB
MEEVVNKEMSAGKEPMGLAATVLYASSIRNEEKNTTKRYRSCIRSNRGNNQK